MLELCNNYSTQITNLKDFITVAYIIIDDIYQEVTPTHIKDRRNINDSIMSDSEIITISIVGELLTIDSEKAWYNFAKRNLNDLFPRFCDRTRFNRIRRALQQVIQIILRKLYLLMGYDNDCLRIIDSIPVPVCKFGRAHFHKLFKEYATYGRCASKKETYLGFKLHLLITQEGFVTDFAITSANIDDRVAMWDLLSSYNSIALFGDKGYIGEDVALDLKQEKNITLIPLKRNKSKSQYSTLLRQKVFKLRRRVETTASQLTCQLNIERVLAKSILGLITRIKTKLLGYNLCYYINRLFGLTADISRIKALIFG